MNELYIDEFTSDNELYTKVYYKMFHIYGVNRQNEYQFVYDEFLDHLISDCKKYVEKNFNPTKSSKHYLYKMEVFKRMFNTHLSWSSSSFCDEISSWSLDKIRRPEKYPEVIKRLRNYKLEKIKENYGN